ncbi:unnamed protein product, partial [Linum tenue]
VEWEWLKSFHYFEKNQVLRESLKNPNEKKNLPALHPESSALGLRLPIELCLLGRRRLCESDRSSEQRRRDCAGRNRSSEPYDDLDPRQFRLLCVLGRSRIWRLETTRIYIQVLILARNSSDEV